MKNKKGFTLVEVVVSVVLIMVVLLYLIRTIIVVSNKNNELVTLQEYSVYENTLLEKFYDDVDQKILDDTKLKGIKPDESNENLIHFQDMQTDLNIDVQNGRIIYDNIVYKLPDNVSFRQVNGQYYSVDYVNNVYDSKTMIIVDVYLKEYNKDEMIKFMYQGVLDAGEGWTVTLHWNNSQTAENVTQLHVQHGKTLTANNITDEYTNGVLALEGWYDEREGGNKRNFPITVLRDMDLYAHWGTAGYSVVYHGNCEGVTGTMRTSYVSTNAEGGTDSFALQNNKFACDGREFQGWNTASDGTGTAYIDKATLPELTSEELQDMVTNNNSELHLYAQWSPKKNKVYLQIHMNGGTLISPHGSAIGVSGGGTGSYITISNSSFIHTINWDENMGENGIANYNNKTWINIGKTGYSIPEHAEYYLMGNTSKTYDQTTNYKASDFCDASNSDCVAVLVLNWKPRVYNVALNRNCSNPASESGVTTQIFEKYNTGYYKDQAATLKMSTTANGVTVPSCAGYTFAGYYTSKTGGTKYIETNGKLLSNASSTYFTSSGTLYAHWTANNYTVTYEYLDADYSAATYTGYYNYGCRPTSSADSYKVVKWSGTATYGSPYTTQANWWTCPGWTFESWNENKDGSGVRWKANSTWSKWGPWNGDNYARNVHLYAIWSENDYKIHYVYSGDYSKCTSSYEYTTWTTKSIKYSENYKIEANWWNCSGWEFKGWNTKKDGTGKTYNASSTYNKITATDNSTVTLYAQWKEVPTTPPTTTSTPKQYTCSYSYRNIYVSGGHCTNAAIGSGTQGIKISGDRYFYYGTGSISNARCNSSTWGTIGGQCCNVRAYLCSYK